MRPLYLFLSGRKRIRDLIILARRNQKPRCLLQSTWAGHGKQILLVPTEFPSPKELPFEASQDRSCWPHCWSAWPRWDWRDLPCLGLLPLFLGSLHLDQEFQIPADCPLLLVRHRCHLLGWSSEPLTDTQHRNSFAIQQYLPADSPTKPCRVS